MSNHRWNRFVNQKFTGFVTKSEIYRRSNIYDKTLANSNQRAKGEASESKQRKCDEDYANQ